MDKELEQSNEPEPSGISRGIMIWLCVTLAFYALSVGPVAGIIERVEPAGGKLGSAAEAFYAPLGALAELPPFERPVRAYIDWWIVAFQ